MLSSLRFAPMPLTDAAYRCRLQDKRAMQLPGSAARDSQQAIPKDSKDRIRLDRVRTGQASWRQRWPTIST
jgi:hypothetical protein